MKPVIDSAFILAAGLGSRMRPLTDSCPKPFLTLGGSTLVDHALDRLEEAGVRKVVVNLHHLAEVGKEKLGTRTHPEIVLSFEPVLLDTGGGIAKMIGHFKDKPFFITSGDGFWIDRDGMPALERMKQFWQPEIMDILILLQPVAQMHLTHGVGDYNILENGQAVRSKGRTGTHMFTSVRINSPAIFNDCPEGAFSYLSLLDRAEAEGRLYAIENTGDWHHLSTPEDLANVESALKGIR